MLNVVLWMLAHKAELVEIALAVGAVVSSIVALLPSSAAKSKAIAMLGRLSALTHKDAPGTFKMPGAPMPTEASEAEKRFEADVAALLNDVESKRSVAAAPHGSRAGGGK
jgi:hypothetical protein